MTLKRCKACGKDKDATDEFGVKRVNSNTSMVYRYGRCKTCMKVKRQAYWFDKREKACDNAKKWKKNNPEKDKALRDRFYKGLPPSTGLMGDAIGRRGSADE